MIDREQGRHDHLRRTPKPTRKIESLVVPKCDERNTTKERNLESIDAFPLNQLLNNAVV